MIQQLRASHRYQRIVRSVMTWPMSTGRSTMEGRDGTLYSRDLLATLASVVERGTSPEFSSREFFFETPEEVAKRCHAHHGVWPISFSWPGALTPPKTPRATFVTDIAPGKPYEFDQELEYYGKYSTAHYGLTHKKAGWDCFRHIELLAHGAMPLMPDIEQVPDYTMVHYPKRFMREAFLQAVKHRSVPDRETREQLHKLVARYLTSQAMMDYVLKMSGPRINSVLFIDESLPRLPDYLSICALYGLKQLLGDQCVVAFPVPYSYRGWVGDASSFHGRGFGYVGKLDTTDGAGIANGALPEPLVRHNLDLDEYDAIVVGSVTRNPVWVRFIDKATTSASKYFLRGDDYAPYRRERRALARMNGQVFVREIY